MIGDSHTYGRRGTDGTDGDYAYLFGLMLLYILTRLLLIPLRLAIRLLISGAIGGFLLWLVNLLGMFVGVYLPINSITALVAGFLEYPE